MSNQADPQTAHDVSGSEMKRPAILALEATFSAMHDILDVTVGIVAERDALRAALVELRTEHFRNRCDIASCGCPSSTLAATVDAALALAEGKAS